MIFHHEITLTHQIVATYIYKFLKN